MKRLIRVRVRSGEKFYVADCVDLPIVTQAVTLDELMTNVQEAIALTLEGEEPANFGLSEQARIRATYEMSR